MKKVHAVRNSYDFTVKLKHICPWKYAILFFNVKSFFINIPIQKVLDCLERLYVGFITLPLKSTKFWIQFICVRQIAFIFNSSLYSKIEDLGLWWPLEIAPLTFFTGFDLLLFILLTFYFLLTFFSVICSSVIKIFSI